MMDIKEVLEGNQPHVYITIRPNQSATVQNIHRLLLVMVVWFLVAGLFLSHIGAWPVIVCMFLCILGLSIAFQEVFTKAQSSESIRVDNHQFIWETFEQGATTKEVFNANWIHLNAIYDRNGDCCAIHLKAHAKTICLAKQTTYEERAKLLSLLQTYLGKGFRSV